MEYNTFQILTNRMFMISFCGNVLAGSAQILPSTLTWNAKYYFAKKTSDKIELFSMNYFGATFGVMAYKALSMLTPLSNQRIILISLGVAAGGAFYTKSRIGVREGKKITAEQDQILFKVYMAQLTANTVLGAVALFSGERVFGTVALLSTLSNINFKGPLREFQF